MNVDPVYWRDLSLYNGTQYLAVPKIIIVCEKFFFEIAAGALPFVKEENSYKLGITSN
jgi:hypothetical protein